jgi:DNA-binding CsgD family transcriptional regulator
MVRLDLIGCTARQYAMLIMREDLHYSYQKCGIKLGISRYAAFQLYKRAKIKSNGKHNNIQEH